MSRRLVSVLDAVEDVSGGNVKTPQKEYADAGDYPIVDQGKSLVGGFTDDKSRMCKADPPVIVFGDHTRAVKFIDFPFCMGADGTKVLAPRKGNDPKYLFHAISALNLEGAGYSRHFKFLKEKRIPLPPLAEQKRIAKILDAADALRAKRRESLAQLDALLQSTFLEMFGDPVENPKGWPRMRLEKIAPITAPLVDPSESEYSGLLHYGPDRIEKATGRLMAAATAEQDGLISKKFLCQPGDILYSKIRPYLNKVAIAREVCLCSADVYPVRAREDVLATEYLWTLLRSDAFLDYAAGYSRRANIPKLNRKQFAGYEAPVPPLSLQRRYSEFLEEVWRDEARRMAQLEQFDHLFSSLQHRAFSGQL